MKGLVYRIVRVIIFLLAKIIFRLRIIGQSNIPKVGGAIIAANHVSYLDPPLIGCSILRKVNFMAMAELFDNPFCGILHKVLGGFPVKRGEANTGAIRHAIRLLKKGELVLIFPEGTRSYDGRLQEPKGGTGMIAALSGAKVVPTFIKGTEKALARGSWRLKPLSVTVYFGTPLEFTDDLSYILSDSTKGRMHDDLIKRRKRLYGSINIKIMDEIAKIQKISMGQVVEN